MSVRTDFITGMIDDISGYFLDHCPKSENWEDFDPDLDEIRTMLQGLLELQRTQVR